MARSFMGEILEEVMSITQLGLADFQDQARHDADKSLLRRIRRDYDKLSLEETLQVAGALGHRNTEEDPCDICKLMAQKEFELSED